MKTTKKLLYLAAALEMTGLTMLAVVMGSLMTQPNAGAYIAPAASTSQQQIISDRPVVSGKPRSLRIPGVGIDTNVQDGSYDPSTANWTITEDAAFFATISAEANDSAGNTFVYGHNSQKILGKLRSDVPAGTTAYVQTDTGYEFTYVYKESHIVSPSDVSKLNPVSDKSLLMLQTCTGLFNESRKFVYFEFVSQRQL